MTDLSYYQAGEMEGLAQRALTIAADMRDTDPGPLLDLLTVQCATEPAKSAQLIQCMALLIDPDQPYTQLEALVARASQPVTRRAS